MQSLPPPLIRLTLASAQSYCGLVLLIAGSISCGASEDSVSHDPEGLAPSVGPSSAAEHAPSSHVCNAPLRKPHNEHGITAAWHTPDGSLLTIVSRDKLWNYQWSTGTWHSAGNIKDIPPFFNAPLVNARKPWEGPGITAAWHTQDNSILTIISKDLYWNLQWSTSGWISSGLVQNLPPFSSMTAATHGVDGLLPWQGAGITASWHSQNGSVLSIVSEYRFWNLNWTSGTSAVFQAGSNKRLWEVPFFAGSDQKCCKNIPGIVGSTIDFSQLWEGAGVTAAWHTFNNATLTLVSENKLWNLNWGPPTQWSPDTPMFLENVHPFNTAPGIAR
jgi:hypothetical protein